MILTEQQVVDDLYSIYSRDDEPHRDYLGGSALGKPCERALWYAFRRALDVSFGGRMIRLFATGHREEARVIDDLRRAGYDVLDRDPKTGEQFAVSAFGGHLRGHLDILVRGIPSAPKQWHVADVKTANCKSFDRLEKVGLREWKPEYYAQLTAYTGLLRMEWSSLCIDGDAPSAMLIIVHCKDDERLWVERIHWSESDFDDLGAKAHRIITSEGPPEKLRHDADYYLCKWCDYSGICHEKQAPRVDCRTCGHATPSLDGGWRCEKLDCILPDFVGCPSHLFIPPLLENLHGTVIEFDGERVTYQSGWVNDDDMGSSWLMPIDLETGTVSA